MQKENIDFKFYSTDDEYIIEFSKEPKIKQDVMVCSNGAEILSDTHIKKLMGNKTSAGFGRINCADGWSFKYLGKLNVLLEDRTEKKHTLVLFDVFHNGTKINEPYTKEDLFDCEVKYYYPCYILIENILDEKTNTMKNNLFFSNKGNAGRIVETDIVEFVNEAKNKQNKLDTIEQKNHTKDL